MHDGQTRERSSISQPSQAGLLLDTRGRANGLRPAKFDAHFGRRSYLGFGSEDGGPSEPAKLPDGRRKFAVKTRALNKNDDVASSRESTEVPLAMSIRERVWHLDWPALAAELDEQGCAATGPLLRAQECRGPCRYLCRGCVVSQPHHHGAPWVWAGRVQVLRLSAAASRGGAAGGVLSVAGRHRKPLERSHGNHRTLSGRGTRIPRALPRRRSVEADAACCCNTGPATTIACTRTCMASMSSRCRPRCCCRSLAATSPAANSCSRSSGRACSRGSRSCRYDKVRA
jgi:hypothetical protein